MKNALAKWLLSGLGLGYLPVAPGTWGSLGATLVFVLVALLSGADGWTIAIAMLCVVGVSSAICVAFGPLAEKAWQKKDPGQVTIDEWAGQALTFLLVPLGDGSPTQIVVRASFGFLLFRIFDIIKPPPAQRLERLPAGWGVLLDDLMAGVYANIVMQVGFRVFA